MGEKMKLILTILALLLLIGCTNEVDSQKQLSTAQEPVVGGGCGVAETEETGEVNYIPLKEAF